MVVRQLQILNTCLQHVAVPDIELDSISKIVVKENPCFYRGFSFYFIMLNNLFIGFLLSTKGRLASIIKVGEVIVRLEHGKMSYQTTHGLPELLRHWGTSSGDRRIRICYESIYQRGPFKRLYAY